jgi:putative DNA modification/repair radical SAM protein
MLLLSDKLTILSGAAKYDVSCASGGSKRDNPDKGLGNTNDMGICHSFTEDGRCVSLLKILMTNYCIYDCAYCVSKKSNDIKRAAFTIKEVIDITINFYRRNYIEGLFLSSGIFKNADYTMERLVRVAKELRTNHHFYGYIHLKVIPGASKELLQEAGLYADRLSVNVELPSEQSLVELAPEKNYREIFTPMEHIMSEIISNQEEQKIFKSAPKYAGAGQSTQMVIGASPESDFTILKLSDNLYKSKKLKRIYYSAYVPASNDPRLSPTMNVPVLRENRLYQADWLLRLYGFSLNELFSASNKTLSLEIDPKLSYALNNMQVFPVEVNTAEYTQLLRVPGIGIKSAKKIFASRLHTRLGFDHLKKMGVILSKAAYFITCSGKRLFSKEYDPLYIRQKIQAMEMTKNQYKNQLELYK